MTTLSVIENKISAIKKYEDILNVLKKYSRDQVENDLNIRGAVERYLYLIVQATIDLADGLISVKNFRKPATIKEGFEILEDENIISAELREKMIKLAGFRNVMAHDYEKINYDIVYDVLQNKINDINEFVLAVKKSLEMKKRRKISKFLKKS